MKEKSVPALLLFLQQIYKHARGRFLKGQSGNPEDGFRKGQSGNPRGRRPGSCIKATEIAELLLASEKRRYARPTAPIARDAAAGMNGAGPGQNYNQ